LVLRFPKAIKATEKERREREGERERERDIVLAAGLG
jgi:hypothetical protein